MYGIAEAYLRCKYDNSSLYLLIDVPSDNGSAYTSEGKNYTGNLAIFLDLNMDGLSTSDKADPEFIISSIANETTVSYSANEPSWSSQVIAAQKLGSSPHATKPHRIYEISMPLQPLLQYGEHSSPDNLPAINIELSVRDSFGNGLGLVGPPYLSELDFGCKTGSGEPGTSNSSRISWFYSWVSTSIGGEESQSQPAEMRMGA